MRTVFITIPGNTKTQFCNCLASEPGIELELIVQQHKQSDPIKRWWKFYQQHNLRALLREVRFALALRMSKSLRENLRIFHPNNPTNPILPKTPFLETESVNSNAVYEKLRAIAPDLIVVWGAGMLEPRIIKTAKRTINLHLGLCPYYRGAVANQLAVLRGEFHRIGATIHDINPIPDGGAIIKTITPEHDLPPAALFEDLHQRAAVGYLAVVKSIARGEPCTGTPQNMQVGETMLLKDWTPSVRYEVARAVAEWKERGAALKIASPEKSEVLESYEYEVRKAGTR